MMDEAPQYAFIGVRALRTARPSTSRIGSSWAGHIQDPGYKARRQKAFVLAVNCTEPGGTCFCASMNAGPTRRPRLRSGPDRTGRYFHGRGRVRDGAAGDGAGAAGDPPAPSSCKMLARRWLEAEKQMGRTLETSDLPNLLYQNLEHARWDEVAHRCLSCANCTQVCPTCFCSDVQEVSDLTGTNIERVRVWDSCFSLRFLARARRQYPPAHPLALSPMADPQAGLLDRPVRHAGLRGLWPLHHLVPGRHRHHRRDQRHSSGGLTC